jgi:putative oxidoreductase
MTNFPYITGRSALMLLRVSLAVFFMAHALVRIVHGTIPGFAGFLEDQGWPFGLAIVWAITALEIVCGTLLILNQYTRWAAAGLFFIAFMGIVIIHAKLGWFVGEHGTGGMEYSLSLMVSLLVIAAFDAERGRVAKSA